jgi:proline dehydrogenase
VKIPARIRLCKGAYDEPASVAYPEKKDVDDNYVRLMNLLLASGTYHGIATHDPKMIRCAT